MILAPFALALSLLGGQATSPLTHVYTADIISISTSDGQTFVRETEKVERGPNHRSKNTTTSENGTVILEVTEKAWVHETIRPDGSRERREVPLKSLENEFLPKLEEMAGMKLENFGEAFKTQETKEFRIIAGHRCRKDVTAITLQGRSFEYILWVPVETKVKDAISSLESYSYEIEDGKRKLMNAKLVVSLKLGDK